MTDAQLQKILDWIPTMLLAVGLFCTTMAGVYIQLLTKLKELREQGAEIIKQTNGINTNLQTDIKGLQSKDDVNAERISGLEKLLVAQADAAKPRDIPGPQGPPGDTGPQGEKGEIGPKGKGLLG